MEERSQEGVPDNFDYLASYMKEFGIGKDWKEPENREPTEEEIRKFNETSRAPDFTFEKLRHLLAPGLVLTEVQDDATIIEYKNELVSIEKKKLFVDSDFHIDKRYVVSVKK